METSKITITFAAALLVGSFQSFGQTPRPLTTETSDAGSVFIKYFGIDKDSSLHRSWHTLNDATCPVQLVKAGVNTEERIGPDALYTPVVGSLTAKEPIMAMEIRFVLYDVFNDHIVTLQRTWVEDVVSPGPFMFKNSSPVTTVAFRADNNDVQRLLTVVSFVSQVRTKNGTIWRYDPAALVSEFARLLHSKVDETTLSPKAVGH